MGFIGDIGDIGDIGFMGFMLEACDELIGGSRGAAVWDGER